MAEEKTIQTTVSIGAVLSDSLKKALKKADTLTGSLRKKYDALNKQLGGLVSKSASFVKDFAFDYSKAVSAMKRNTGALGKAFDPAEKSLRNVLGKIPLDFQDIGQAVGDVNTLLKYNGKELEETVLKIGKLSQITGQNVQDLTASFALVQKRWGLSQKELMQFSEVAYKSVLSTGLSFSELSDSIGRNSEALRRLGLDQEQSVYLLSNMKNAGIDADRVFSALNKSVDMSAEDFEAWAVAIQDAKTDEDALTLAVNAFGTQAAPEMSKALRSGVFDLQRMKAELDASGASIDKMSAETLGWDETLKILTGNLQKILLPVLQKVNAIIQDAMKWWQGANGQALIGKAKALFDAAKFELTATPEERQERAWAQMTGQLPKKAAGGWVSSPSIAGEAGPEAVISMNPAYRTENLRTWAEAGEALGVNGLVVNVNGMSFSPSISGASDVLGELRAQSREFAAIVAGAIESNIRRAF